MQGWWGKDMKNKNKFETANPSKQEKCAWAAWQLLKLMRGSERHTITCLFSVWSEEESSTHPSYNRTMEAWLYTVQVILVLVKKKENKDQKACRIYVKVHGKSWAGLNHLLLHRCTSNTQHDLFLLNSINKQNCTRNWVQLRMMERDWEDREVWASEASKLESSTSNELCRISCFIELRQRWQGAPGHNKSTLFEDAKTRRNCNSSWTTSTESTVTHWSLSVSMNVWCWPVKKLRLWLVIIHKLWIFLSSELLKSVESFSGNPAMLTARLCILCWYQFKFHDLGSQAFVQKPSTVRREPVSAFLSPFLALFFGFEP